MDARKKYNDLKQISTVLDSKFEFMGLKFGLDGILGLVPVVGDFFTSALSLYIIYQAALLGCSVPTLLRMVLNVMIDNLLDIFPILGNIFDFLWKSNNKNVALLEKHLARPHQTHRQSQWVIASLVGLMLAFFTLTAYLSYLLIQWIIQL
jgi:Domain of unknown function (DUF4112)